MRQEDQATKFGVHLNTYARWERDGSEPSAGQLSPLVMEGWNANWVVTGEGPERLDALKQGVSGAKPLQPDMMQRAVESAIGVFQRFNKLPSANQLARASVMLYLLFTDSEPETAEPVDQLLARIMAEPPNPES